MSDNGLAIELQRYSGCTLAIVTWPTAMGPRNAAANLCSNLAAAVATTTFNHIHGECPQQIQKYINISVIIKHQL